MTLPEMIKMTIKPSPFSIRAAGSAIVLALGLTAAPAGAADLTLDLPEQALSRSLNTIAQKGQIQLLYDAGQLGALRAPALHGSYSAQTAIQTLLAGSGLTLVQQGSSYVIRPLTTEAETILIPETRVQGELAYHPATDVMSARNTLLRRRSASAIPATATSRNCCAPTRRYSSPVMTARPSTRAKSNHHGFPFTAHPVSRTPINSTASVLTTISTRQKIPWVKPPPVWTAATRACI
ncbi:Ferric-pseudobactin 358 receptor precursor [Morganella morganii]|nr:Ferric-pseudobactin 358 receptor precursor [Morganella morganii]